MHDMCKIWVVLALVMSGTVHAEAADTRVCIEDFSEQADYFPEKAVVEAASNFSVEYHGYYKLVTVPRPYSGGRAETYLLVQCGAPVPDLDISIAATITIPIQSVFVGSTTQNPSLEALGRLAAITGVAHKDYISLPSVVERVASMDVVEFEPNGVLDAEKVVASWPDAFMSAGSSSAELATIRNIGIPVIHHADYQENTPLGRAEWVKFTSTFFNDEEKANGIYQEIARDYLEASSLVSSLPEEARPKVLSGAAYEGIFFAAGGESFVANAIRDAGGRYIFSDNTSTGSFQIHDLERLIVSALEADFWIHASNSYSRLSDIEADDPRLAQLPAALSGQVWMPDALKGENGGIQFYELGTLRPDLVLRDLISIFHPELESGHQRVFYRSILSDDAE